MLSCHGLKTAASRNCHGASSLRSSRIRAPVLQLQQQLLGSKRGFAKKKPSIKPDTHLNTGQGEEIGKYGLRKVDYSKPPPMWPMPPHPPESKGFRRFVFPISLALSLTLFGYIYFNQEDDIQEYWKAVDTGHVPLDLDDDDDDDDDDDE